MDPDERHIMREEARCQEEYYCTGCGKHVEGIAAIDPIIIDDVPWCDWCASDLTLLRMSGEIGGVAEKVARLTHEFNKELYYKVYDRINFGS